MQTETHGEFGGLGIEVTMEEGLIKVIAPIDDTPAARAGILANDIVTQINGEPVQGLTLHQAVDKLRGPVNSSVKLTIQRKEKKEPIEAKLTRETIRIRPVRARTEGDDIGYLRITPVQRADLRGPARRDQNASPGKSVRISLRATSSTCATTPAVSPVPWPRPPVKPSDCRMIFCSVPFLRIATCAADRLRRSLPPGSPGSAISRRRRPSVACWSAWLRARQRHRHPIHPRRHAGWRGAPVPGLDRCSCRTVTPRRSPPPERGRPTARRSLSAAWPHSGSARAMPPCRSKLPTATHRRPHCARREHSGPPGSLSAAAIAGNLPSGCAAPRWRAIRSMA